jgi:glycerol-3-phosphate O-acyltransferase
VETDSLLHFLGGTEFILEVRKKLENGKLSADAAGSLEELYYNYKNAVNALAFCFFISWVIYYCYVSHINCILLCQVLQNGDPNAYDIMISNMMAIFDRVLLDCQVPTFYYCFINIFCCSGSFFNAPMCLFILGFILLQNPFTFQPYHKATREPSSYYMFGQNYIRPLVDFR